MRRIIALTWLLVGVALVACTAEVSPEGGGKKAKRHAAKSADGAAAQGHAHGRATWLGKIGEAGSSYDVDQMGNLSASEAMAFKVTPLDDGMIDASAQLQAWLEAADGAAVSPRVTTQLAKTDFHFHLTPDQGQAAPAKLALLPAGGKEEATLRVGLQPGWGAHDGLLAFLREQGKHVGVVEIKVHDDKGDVELWLIGADGKPLDLPLETTVNLIFPYESRDFELAVRNQEKNEDEDGQANVRDGKTNYFIFPGESGADPTWLKGAEFQAAANVVIQDGGRTLMSDVVWLVPHTHGGGHGHEHGHSHEKGAGHEHEHEHGKAPAHEHEGEGHEHEGEGHKHEGEGHEHGEQAPEKKDG